MSNYSAFTKEYLMSIVEPFLPGGTDHVTPVKYEALSPDLFAFLVRTTGRGNRDHFFVALEFDYVKDVAAAQQIITDWHGSFHEFLAPEDSSVAGELGALSAPTDGPYRAVFAEVGPPASPSYWTDNQVLYPDSPIDGFLDNFSDTQRSAIRDAVTRIRDDHPDVSIAVHVNPDETTDYYYK